MENDDQVRRIAIELSNGEIRKPGEKIPTSHVFGLKLDFAPKLAKGKVELPKGTRVLVSGNFYKHNFKSYPLLREYGLVCIYANGWLTPVLREAQKTEKETTKQNVFIPFVGNRKIGSEENLWPIIEEL